MVVLHTAMGWTLQGPSVQKGIVLKTTLIVGVLSAQTMTDEETVTQTLKAFWELDSVGITDVETANTQQSVAARFDKSIVKVGESYQVALPWKEVCVEVLKSNRQIALTRLYRLIK